MAIDTTDLVKAEYMGVSSPSQIWCKDASTWKTLIINRIDIKNRDQQYSMNSANHGNPNYYGRATGGTTSVV